MKNLLLFFIYIVILSGCLGGKNVLDGETAFKNKQYLRANELLKEEFNEEKNQNSRARKAFMIAQTYEYLLQPDQAPDWYQQADQNGYGVKSKLALAYAYKVIKEYTKSIALFRELAKYNTLAEECTKQANALEALIKEKTPDQYSWRILNLNTDISSSVYAPVFLNEDELLVSSDAQMSEGEITYPWTGRKHADLFIISKFGGQMRSFGALFNTGQNEGAATFNKSRDEIFFTRCKSETPNGDEFCAIFYSKKTDDQWSEPQRMDFFNEKTNFGQPALVENDSVMVFVSLSEGGQNGYDLWYTDRFDGAWSEPFPMPANLNTQGNEYFPTADKDTLYFSSDFHPGYGGLDIFKTWLSDGKWVNPVRLEAPLNSSYDDYSFIKDPTAKTGGNLLQKGYFCSNRGGKGVDDLYSFEKFSKLPFTPTPVDTPVVVAPPIAKEEPKPKPEVPKTTETFSLYLAGRVIDNSTKGNPFVRSRPVPNARITWKERDTVIQRFAADRNGVFIRTSSSGKIYEFTASADSFLSKSVTVVTTNISKPEGNDLLTVNFEIPLDKIIRNREIVLNNIYYDLDQSFIRNDAKPTLDSLANILALNPGLEIELGSHTDCRGEDDYNLALSQRRAQAAVDYLISKGISTNRLSAKGYGETAFAINCECTLCTEEQHQVNRRTTFKIK